MSRLRLLLCLAALLLPLNAMAEKVLTTRKPTARPAASAAARADDLLPLDVVERELPNGLKVMVVPTGFPNLVSIQIPVKTGSRNEIEPGKSGFAHFFEHMWFRGTPTHTPEKMSQVNVEAGARANAYTSDDLTNYHVTFAKEDLETMLRMYADVFQNLSYSEEAFKTESRAVLGEYNKNSANPISKLFEVQRESAFTTHTYRHTTMGFIKDIEDMPNQFEYSRVFFDRWYRPENVTIIVAGDVKSADVMPLIEKYWAGWKRGAYKAQIPAEPAPQKAVYAHVPWTTPTLPWVSVAFHGAAFSETAKDYAALNVISQLFFGETSEIYKKLVVDEQKVDQLFVSNPLRIDPSLFSVMARVKKAEDAVAVRDEILKTIAQARGALVSERRLSEAKANLRYGFARGLDNTETIASTIATFAHHRRSFATLNNAYRLYTTLTPADLKAAAQKYFVDNGLVVTTLSKDALAAEIATSPSLESFAVAPLVETPAPATVPAAAASFTASAEGAAATEAAGVPFVIQKSALPLIDVKLMFAVGSASDPKGKEGLALLASQMIADAGSRAMTYDEINAMFYPMAASFVGGADKEMTVFTGVVHRDNWDKFLAVSLPQLLDPGFREEDFRRIKETQLNGLKQDLRANNEEELGKERLQGNLFAGTAYQHPSTGTVAGIESITLDDVREYVAQTYTRSKLTVGVNGAAPPAMLDALRAAVAKLPKGGALEKRPSPTGRRPQGLEVEIVEKDTRATAISFGLPIEVTRSHPDFAALSVVRSWLGEHRASQSRLYQRIREIRGMNYGDYAYIEAFPGGMYQFFPSANVARRAQIFEVWIRPVVPANAHMALRIAIHELRQMLAKGMTKENFETTRNYLMKNVYLMTARQDQQLGYALDSKWYEIPDYTAYMREQLQKLTLEDVNRAMRQHLSGDDLSIVMITKDAKGLRDALVSDAVSTMTYEADKPADLLEEDKQIGALKLGIKPEKVKITPVDAVFAN